MRHFGRRPLGSATSLPAMMNLGQKVDGAHEKENGSENNKEPEEKIEGEEYTACHLLLVSTWMNQLKRN